MQAEGPATAGPADAGQDNDRAGNGSAEGEDEDECCASAEPRRGRQTAGSQKQSLTATLLGGPTARQADLKAQDAADTGERPGTASTRKPQP